LGLPVVDGAGGGPAGGPLSASPRPTVIVFGDLDYQDTVMVDRQTGPPRTALTGQFVVVHVETVRWTPLRRSTMAPSSTKTLKFYRTLKPPAYHSRGGPAMGFPEEPVAFIPSITTSSRSETPSDRPRPLNYPLAHQ
jgi:hypothetical protein